MYEDVCWFSESEKGDKMRSFTVRLVLIWGSWWGEADEVLEVARWLYWVWGLVDYGR